MIQPPKKTVTGCKVTPMAKIETEGLSAGEASLAVYLVELQRAEGPPLVLEFAAPQLEELRLAVRNALNSGHRWTRT